MSLARSLLPTAAIRRSAPKVAAAATRSFTTAKAADSVNVAAVDDGSATTTVTVALKAGPRFESVPGVAHAFKNFLFKGNKKRSALHLIRETELYGGLLSTSATKEHILLTAEFLRGDEDFFVEILGDALSSAKFARHEFTEEVIQSVQDDYELAVANPLVLGFDQLTATAYRNKGLGASLFASPSSPVSYDQTVQYAHSVLGRDRVAVLGSGIASDKLASLVSKHFAGLPATAGASAAPSNRTQYYGGEQRISFAPSHHGGIPASPEPSPALIAPAATSSANAPAGHGHVFLAFEGAAQGSAQAAELHVLRSLLGGESSVKWSYGQSALSQLQAETRSASARASAFNLGWSDAGLFGIYVAAPQDRVGAIAKAAVNALKDAAGSSQAEDVKRAVAKAKFEAATQLESRAASHEALGGQILESGKIQTLDNVFSSLDQVDASAVSKAAEKLLKSKPTLVAVGDLHKLPYADEIL